MQNCTAIDSSLETITKKKKKNGIKRRKPEGISCTMRHIKRRPSCRKMLPHVRNLHEQTEWKNLENE